MRVRSRRNIAHCWGACKLGQLLWQTVWGFLKKLRLELPLRAATPLLGICPTALTVDLRGICTPTSTRHSSRRREAKPPQRPRRNDTWSVHTLERYSALKREGSLTHAAAWGTLKPAAEREKPDATGRTPVTPPPLRASRSRQQSSSQVHRWVAVRGCGRGAGGAFV